MTKHCKSGTCTPPLTIGTRYKNGNRWTDPVTEARMRRELRQGGFREVTA